MSNPNLNPEGYTEWHSIIKTVTEFFQGPLKCYHWDTSGEDEVIMDIGCGPGGTTKDLILPFFPNIKRIIAVDVMAEMITIARQKNAHPLIEYVLADITDWFTVGQWDRKITKIISIHCFHWLKEQKMAFENVYYLLVPGGQAAFFFVLEATFFDVIQDFQNYSKWSQYLKGHDNRIPMSHNCKLGASYYKSMLESIGFLVLHCEEKWTIDSYDSDEKFKNFFSSLCVLMPFIPDEHKEEFKDDMVRELLKRNGRTEDGHPFHRGLMLSLVVKKK